MSDTVSFAELDGQHVELLPARTVLSMLTARGADGGTGGDGTDGTGTINIKMFGRDLLPGGGNGVGMAGSDASGKG